MHKKLGPLETWQWLAIGAAAGILYYLYQRYQANQAANSSTGTTTTSGTSSDLGPIDPTTGEPYALEGAYNSGAASTTAAQNSGPTTLSQELSDLAAIEGLQAGGTQITPDTTTSAISALQTALGNETAAVKTLTAAEKAQAKLINELKLRVAALQKAATPAGKHNPGHTVTTHNGGKQTATSSAPHSGNNHSNIAPPTHQRHPPTRHPSKPKATVGP